MDYDVCNTACSTYACVHTQKAMGESEQEDYLPSLFPVPHFLSLLNLGVKQATWSGQAGLGCMIITAFLFFFYAECDQHVTGFGFKAIFKKKKT